MKYAKRLVAIRNGWHDDAETHDICQMFHKHIFRLHLAPDRIWGFATAKDLAFNTALVDIALYFLTNTRDHIIRLRCQKFETVDDGLALFRNKNSKGSIFKLALDVREANPFCQRRVNISCLSGDALFFILARKRFNGLHIMRSISQFDQ